MVSSCLGAGVWQQRASDHAIVPAYQGRDSSCVSRELGVLLRALGVATSLGGVSCSRPARYLVSRRSLLILPAVLAVTALPVAPALAGEDEDSASLDAPSRACVKGHMVKAAVESFDDIDAVTFSVDGRRVRRVTEPAATGRFVFAMRCSRLSVGAHRARARVSFESGDTQTLRFQIIRVRQASPRFTG
jgi:hypothetical protein